MCPRADGGGGERVRSPRPPQQRLRVLRVARSPRSSSPAGRRARALRAPTEGRACPGGVVPRSARAGARSRTTARRERQERRAREQAASSTRYLDDPEESTVNERVAVAESLADWRDSPALHELQRGVRGRV